MRRLPTAEPVGASPSWPNLVARNLVPQSWHEVRMGDLIANCRLRESTMCRFIATCRFAEPVAADLKLWAEAVAIAGVKLQ
jgi:hypothetical protein